MSKQKAEDEVTKVGEDVKVEQKEFKPGKDAIVDVAVTVISLEGDPYHKNGAEFQLAKKTANELAERGWVKIKK